MSNQYEKLHIDDEALSRILQTVENADLDAYRDRPEFLQKERPELAEVGDPGEKKTRVGSSGGPGYRKNMSRMLINGFTIAAAAALTLLIAVPLVRINSGNPHSSQDAKVQTSGNTNMQTAGDTKIPTPGDAKIPASGDAEMPTSGDAEAPTIGDAAMPAAGEENSPDNDTAPAGEYAEDNGAEPSLERATSISSDLVVAAFRNYYDGTFTVELNEVTPETVSVTVSGNAENSVDRTLTVTVDLATGETVTVDETGSQIETGIISEDGIYSAYR